MAHAPGPRQGVPPWTGNFQEGKERGHASLHRQPTRAHPQLAFLRSRGPGVSAPSMVQGQSPWPYSAGRNQRVNGLFAPASAMICATGSTLFGGDHAHRLAGHHGALLHIAVDHRTAAARPPRNAPFPVELLPCSRVSSARVQASQHLRLQWAAKCLGAGIGQTAHRDHRAAARRVGRTAARRGHWRARRPA